MGISQLDARLSQEAIHWGEEENRLGYSFLSSKLADGAVSTLGHACNNLPDLKLCTSKQFSSNRTGGF